MPKVIVVGSVNVDTVLMVNRHPRVGETIFTNKLVIQPGGKGANQAVAAAKAGAQTYLVGLTGDDNDGRKYRQHLINCDVDISHLGQVEGYTGSAYIVVDSHGENTIVVDPGANQHIGEAQVQAVRELVEPGDVVTTMNEVPTAAIIGSMEAAKEGGATTVFNPSPWEEDMRRLVEMCDVVVANEFESQQLGSENRSIAMTFGARGALWDGIFAPAPAVEAFDSTGAGDVFTGTLCAMLAQGASKEDALTVAVHKASHSVTHQGAQIWTV